MLDILSNGGLSLGLSEPVITIILGAAIIFGLILVFAGRLLWIPIMSIIGGFIGATLGYIIGYSASGENWMVGLLGAIIGGLLGSLLFSAFIEAAIAFLAGLVLFGIVYASTGSWIIALIAAIPVFLIVVIFIEKIIAILTAIVGGLIVGISLNQLGLITIEIAAVITLVLIVAGSLVQIFVLKDRGRARPSKYPTCARCGREKTYDQYSSRWICPDCEIVARPPPPDTW